MRFPGARSITDQHLDRLPRGQGCPHQPPVLPVQVHVHPGPGTEPPGAAGNATVLTRAFFGHDQVLAVQLDTGRVLRARLGPYGGIRTGDRVVAGVRGAVLVFPRPEST